MVKNYTYIVHHDTGFAPHIEDGICSVCGCKKITVEKDAKIGSWVIGTGGVKTGQKGKLIYAMEVDRILSYEDFKKEFPKQSGYLVGMNIESRAHVLIATKRFHYFGNKAVSIPDELKSIVHTTHGRKCVSKDMIEKLISAVLSHFPNGVQENAQPNNQTKSKRIRCPTNCPPSKC